MDYLNEHGIIKIDKLMEMFGISIETARRDLSYLEKEGLIKKIYGGATIIEQEAKEPANAERLSKNIDEKTAIGQKCADFINDGDSVFLEVGTTVLQVAKALKNKKNLTVITNSIPIVNELMDTDFNIYISGGKIRHGEGSISGTLSMFEMENFHIGKAIIGAGGITLDYGLSDFRYRRIPCKKKNNRTVQRSHPYCRQQQIRKKCTGPHSPYKCSGSHNHRQEAQQRNSGRI